MFAAPRGRWIEALILSAAFIAVNLAGAVFQPRLSHNGGKGWEGVSYYRMAEQFARGEPVAVPAPMVFRVGAPFLASRLFKSDLFRSFKAVNIAANAITLALLIVWLRLYLRDWKVRVLLGLLFLLQWDAPTRWVYYYPVHTDPWLWVFLLLGLIAIHHVQRGERMHLWLGWLGGISFLGVIFREVALMIPLALLFVRNPLIRTDGILSILKNSRPPPPVFFLPLASGLLAMLLVRRAVTPTDGYSFLWTAQHWAYTKPFPSYLHGWLLAFGPVLFVLLYDWRRAGRFLAGNQFLLLYLLGFAVLGYIGGTDTERLLYWSMPVVYLLLGRALEENKPLLASAPLVATLAVGQLIGSRAFWTTPDYPSEAARSIPLLTPVGSQVPFLDLFSFHGNRLIEVISFAEYLAFGAVLFLWLSARRRKTTSVPPAPARERCGEGENFPDPQRRLPI